MTTLSSNDEKAVDDALRNICLKQVEVDNASVVEVATRIAALASSSEKNSKILQSPVNAVPLRFDNIAEEVNFWALLQLVAGPCDEMPAESASESRSSEETCQLGILSMFLTQKAGTDQLLDIDLSTIASFFDMTIQQDVEVMPAVYQSEASPMQAVAVNVQQVLQKTAKKLFARQSKSFGEWIHNMIVDRFKKVTENSPEAKISAIDVVNELVQTFESFDSPNTLHRHAQLLVLILYSIFSESEAAYSFTDMEKLNFSADKALAMKLEKLRLTTSASETLDSLGVATVVASIATKVRDVLEPNSFPASNTCIPYIVDQFLRSDEDLK